MSVETPIMVVLDDVIDCVLFGSGGVFAIPPGGRVECSRRRRDDAYRVTIDVCIRAAEHRVEPKGIGARRVLAFEARKGGAA